LSSNTPAAAVLSATPAIGIGFRLPIVEWTMANLGSFDVFEITVDHYIYGGDRTRGAIKDLVGRIPLVAHGIGLSIGTDVPVDEAYLAQVAAAIEALKIPSYSEHLAWTKVPGYDVANLLPVPKSYEVAESLIEKIKFVQAYLDVPFSLENISYVFDFPDSALSDSQFFNLIFQETGVGMLLDVENVLVNSQNYGFDALTFLDELPAGIATGMHMAGGPVVERPYLDGPFWVDSHAQEVPDQALMLLAHALQRQQPQTIIVERDARVQYVDEIASDVARVRKCVAALGNPAARVA